MHIHSILQAIIRKIIISIILLICLQKSSYLQVVQFDQEKSISQFILKSWTVDQGLKTNTLIDLIQTNDGYIWIGTYEGIIRFDGINFTTFNRINTKALLSDAITILCEDKNNNLWIGTQKGRAAGVFGGCLISIDICRGVFLRGTL